MIRAYHDPGLRYPISRTGRWERPLEFVLARGERQTKTIYLYNNEPRSVLCAPLNPAVEQFVVEFEGGVRIPPGISTLQVTVAGTAKTPPHVEDFVLRYIGEGVTPPTGYSDLDFSDWDAYNTSPFGLGAEAFRLEISAFVLPAGDERFGPNVPSHLRSTETFRDYIASGMGLVHRDFLEKQVQLSAEMTRPLALWAVNKHYLHDPFYGPLRHARNRADLIAYNPPGLDQFPPKVRRRVLGNAFRIIRSIGTHEGYVSSLEALGIEVGGVQITHDSLNHIWYIRLPRYAVGIFDIDYLGQYALYHTDAYSVINLSLIGDAHGVIYSDIDYSISPIGPREPGLLRVTLPTPALYANGEMQAEGAQGSLQLAAYSPQANLLGRSPQEGDDESLPVYYQTEPVEYQLNPVMWLGELEPEEPVEPPAPGVYGVRPDAPEPSGDYILIQPGQNMNSIINGAPSGSTFAFAPGVHRTESSVALKTGNTYWGFKGAIISGARLLTNPVDEGNGVWSYSGQHDYISWNGPGQCEGGGTLCLRPNDIYIDDVPKYRVGSVAQLTEDSYYYDEGAGKVYIGMNPAGRKVELGIAGSAFQSGSVSNITIRNLTVEKFANAAQRGAIMNRTVDGSTNPIAPGWLVEDCTVRFNHGLGLWVGTNSVARHCDIYENGQMGIGAGGQDGLIEWCDIHHNKYAQYLSGWEGGASKFQESDGLIVRRNWVHDNYGGYGIWTDVSNENYLCEYNLVEDEPQTGIFHEISYNAIIRRNLVRRTGLEWGKNSHGWVYGSGILVHNSSDTEVYENVIYDCGGGVTGDEGSRGGPSNRPWILANLNVHDNIIGLEYFPDRYYWNNSLGVAAPNGVYTGAGAPVYSAERNNDFQDNHYYSTEPNRSYFRWQTDQGWSAWQGNGKDVNGSMTQGRVPAGTLPPGWTDVLPDPDDPDPDPGGGDPGGGDPEPDPPPAPTGFSLEGRPEFNPASPTWRDGSPISGQAATIYGGLNWHLANPQSRQPSESFYNAFSIAARDDTYLYGRTLAEIYAGYETALRLTGDLRWLDLWADVAQVQFNNLKTGWPHGKRAWNWRQGGSSTTSWGDTHRDAARAHAPLATLAYALEVNRGRASPGGKNYGALADQWKDYLWNDFHYIWARGSGSWTGDYGAYAGDGEYSGRANPNMLKMFGRPHTHSHIGYIRLGYWMAKLFPDHNWQLYNGTSITPAGFIARYIDDWFLDKNLFAVPNSKYGGTSITWARSMQHFQSGNNYHQPITYATYIFMDMLSLFLEEASSRDYGQQFFSRVWPTVNAWAWLWPWDGNTATSDDIAGNVNRTGTNAEGRELTIVASDFGGRSYTNMAAYAYALSLAWDTPDGFGVERFKHAWESVSAFWNSSSNKIGTPRHLNFPIGWLAALSGMDGSGTPTEPPPTGGGDGGGDGPLSEFDVLMGAAGTTSYPDAGSAYPSAEGFGRNAQGGRGGTIEFITNRNTSGAGSAAAAFHKTGKRYIIPLVWGYVDFGGDQDQGIRIEADQGQFTYFGQFSPGGQGLAFRGGGIGTTFDVRPGAQDMIVRYLKSYRGVPTNRTVTAGDALTFFEAENFMVGNCSVAFGVDENFSLWRSKIATVHDIFVVEPIHSGTHEKGSHGKGTLIGGGGAHSVTALRLFHALCPDRVPWMKLADDGPGEIINCYCFNNNQRLMVTPNDGSSDDVTVNVIKNFLETGPVSAGSVLTNWLTAQSRDASGATRVFAQGNVGPGRPVDSGDQWAGVVDDSGLVKLGSRAGVGYNVRELPASQVKNAVLGWGGASLVLRQQPGSNDWTLTSIRDQLMNDNIAYAKGEKSAPTGHRSTNNHPMPSLPVGGISESQFWSDYYNPVAAAHGWPQNRAGAESIHPGTGKAYIELYMLKWVPDLPALGG